MKTRIVAIVMALMMLTASIALGEAVPAAVSGEYTGTAKGFGGDVTVTITLTEGAITAVTAEGAGETEGIGSVACVEQVGKFVGCAICRVVVVGATHHDGRKVEE